MKKSLSIKRMAPSIVLTVVLSFMLFIYEPITMYANNTNDFWFDIFTLLKVTTIPFLACIIFLSAVLLAIHKFLKPKIATALQLLFLSAFIIAYINSNFLAGFLPQLDGAIIKYENPAGHISSIIVILATLAGAFFVFKRFDRKKINKITLYLPLAIFAMLSVSLITTLATTDAFVDKSMQVVATEKNINKLSTNENYQILLIDTVDSVLFQKLVEENEEYKEMFKDFSYYPDTVSGYNFTLESVPLIFSNEWFQEPPYAEYSTHAYTNSDFFKELDNQNYNRNFYDDDFVWKDESALAFDNIIKNPLRAKKRTFIKQELKYILFKTLPYPIKTLSKIQNMDFSKSMADPKEGRFVWQDLEFKNKYLEMPTEQTEDKLFQFIHIEGGHLPFNLDEQANEIDEVQDGGNYERKLKGLLYIIKQYIDQLKENGAYDNATIVIMSDHGYDTEDGNKVLKRGNPSLYIKGKGEKHSSMKISKKQISHGDMEDAFIELLNGKKSTEIFEDIPEEGRVRLYYRYGAGQEKTMTEFEQRGKAWTTENLTPTGREITRW